MTKDKFNAALYWADKPIKKFVCTIKNKSGNTQIVICGSSTSDRAADIALENSYLTGELTCIEVRLATPTDLGAVPMETTSTQEKLHQFAHTNGLKELNLTDSHILVGNLPAIEHVNTLKKLCDHLSVALVDCMALLAQCEQNQNHPTIFNNPIGSLSWQATLETTRDLIKQSQPSN